MAPAIVEQLGPHTQYFEPFCGSMAVLFAKQPSRQETVNDLHGDLVNLARVLADQKAAVDLYDRLQRVLVCEALLEEAQSELSHEITDFQSLNFNANSAIERAKWYFVASWMCRNGLAGMDRIEYQLAVRWTAGGGSPTIRFRSAIDSIPAWHQRLTNVVILKRDAFTIVDRFEDAHYTAIYVDPPYVKQSRSHGSYEHDFSDSPMFGDDHDRLAQILRRYRWARIVVSYYDCPRIRELYDGWTIIEHTRQKNVHAQNGRGARPKEAPEVLLVNGPSLAKG